MDNELSGESRVFGRYSGTSGEIFKLAFVTGLLTLVTLGIYRFWAKTRVRRYVWSSIDIDGTRFEYTGTGLEKFLGFLVAVVILAIYLGLIQMALFFFGVSLFVEATTLEGQLTQMFAIYATFFAVLPLIYFAVYRARRYKLARTRWRGIRFGMDKGAWGYAFRAIGYGLLTGLTIGILTPLATFRLEKYMTDRSHFGDGKFEQNGRWQSLYPAMKHVAIGIVLLIVAGVFAALEVGLMAVICMFVGYIWFIVGFVYYGVHSFRYLTANKTLNGEIAFAAEPTTSKVIWTYVGGGILIGVLTSIALGLLAAIVGFGSIINGGVAGATPGVGSIVIGVVGYLAIIVAAGAGSLTLIVQPIIKHYVETLTVINSDAIANIAQRESDTGADAEGFADALDIGGAL